MPLRLRASAPARAATPAVTPATRGPGAQEVRIVIDGLPEWPVVSVRQRRHPKRLCCEVARAWREADVNRKRRVYRMGYAGRLKEQAQQAGELTQVRLRDGPLEHLRRHSQFTGHRRPSFPGCKQGGCCSLLPHLTMPAPLLAIHLISAISVPIKITVQSGAQRHPKDAEAGALNETARQYGGLHRDVTVWRTARVRADVGVGQAQL